MSSRPAPGRRPDSLFDNRFRIEQSYPRGRSGETLRAADAQNADEPVVVKRPALQDAPPMRAGQEQIILNEKRVLERLAGQPGIPALRHASTFRAGGQIHQYIAIELAQGESLEALVTTLAASGEWLPDLEMLVIFDALLEALQAAHDQKIIHNRLDANHVYWDRQGYCLRVIGWGGAVFLDGDNPPANISRANDIIQIGQLLYFAISGGKQPQPGSADPAAELGSDVTPRLRAIINRALGGDGQYLNAAAFRQELADLRRPLENSRNNLLMQIQDRLPSANSGEELEELRSMVHRALGTDPGYPPGHEIAAQIESRLGEIAYHSNLHALQVYIGSGNTVRALAVLQELRTQVGENATLQPVLAYLLDVCTHMQAQSIMPPSAGFADAVSALLQGDAQSAGRILATAVETRPAARQQQTLFAELLTQRMPGVILLRPHIAYLADQLAAQGRNALGDEAQAISSLLDKPLAKGIGPLVSSYQDVLKGLDSLAGKLDDDSLIASLDRARYAATQILALLESAVSSVLSDPAHTDEALAQASTIDPGNPVFSSVSRTLNSFRELLAEFQNFSPSGEGEAIATFLSDAETRLKPHLAEITDPQFHKMVQGIPEAAAAWAQVADFIAMGGNRPAIVACQQAAEAIRPLSPPMARWFDAYGQKIEQAQGVENLSPNTELGSALQEGWQMWDRGRAAEAKVAAERALQAAVTPGERQAVQRLIDLSDVLEAWLANDGPLNPRRIDQAESRVTALLTPEEETIRRTFSKQMPDAQIYLRAMAKGIVEPLRAMSAAAVRVLFFHYVLRGMLDLQQDNADQANFWREASVKTLAGARMHPAYQALDAAITRRQLILDAVKALNNVRHVSDLAAARQAVRAPLAASQLEATNQAVRAVDDALNRWSAGDFRAARQLIDTAAERIAFAEAAMGQDLAPFKTWLQDLGASAELLQGTRHNIEQIALVPGADPVLAVAEAHQKLIEITRRDLGEAYTVTLRQWRDTYNSARDLYMDTKLDKPEKLRLFEDYFASESLEDHPALPILRHWYGLLKRQPEPEPAVPPYRSARNAYFPDIDSTESANAAHGDPPPVMAIPATPARAADPQPARRSGPSAKYMVGALVLAVLLGIGVFLFVGSPPGSNNSSATATENVIVLPPSKAPTQTPIIITATTGVTPTDAPTSTPPTLPPTITKVVLVPTATSPTLTPTAGPSSTLGTPTTPTPLPAGGSPVGPNSDSGQATATFAPTAASGDFDMLKALATLPQDKIRQLSPGTKLWFAPNGDSWQLGTSVPQNGPLVVRLKPDVMVQLFGVDAAKKITRIDATLELVSYDKNLLASGQIYFGLGVEAVGGSRASVQANLIQAHIVDLGVSQNGRFVRNTQVPIDTVKMNITIQRNADNTFSLYEDNQLLGQSNFALKNDQAVNIYLYTSTGGILVNVTDLKIHLDSNNSP